MCAVSPLSLLYSPIHLSLSLYLTRLLNFIKAGSSEQTRLTIMASRGGNDA